MRSVGCFLLKCIAAALPALFVIGFTLACPFGYMDEEYPSWRYTKLMENGKEPLGHPVSADDVTLILGDSRAMADLIPAEMGDNVYNLAVGGATGIEMYYTLCHYIKKETVPKRVVIMFAPFHYSYMDNFWTRSIYFRHLTPREALRVYREGTGLNVSTMEDGEHGYSTIISAALGLPNLYMPALLNSRFTGRLSLNREKYDSMCRQRGHGLFGTADGSKDLNYESNYTAFDRTKDFSLLDLYMRRLLALCRENGIETVLMQPPMNRASYEELDADYVSQYTDYIDSLRSDAIPGAVIDPEILCYDNDLFGDSSHLNEKGARLYTAYFMEKLQWTK